MLQGWIQIALTLLIIVAITPVFGNYMARVYQEQKTLLDPIFNPIERLLYALSGVQTREDMTGWQYSKALLYSNLAVCILVGFILFNQGWLPFNPTGLSSSTSNAPTWDVILHTVSSFITGADQQHYSGETTYSYFSQFAGLGFMFFISAASGLAIGIAFIRGMTGNQLGNFYVDLIRSITRILLPLSIVGGIVLVASGVPETVGGLIVIPTLENSHINQAIALGPVAHLEIIKQIGENGGGFFGANSAHPFENPNSFSNLIVTVGMVAIPAAFIYTYGVISNNLKQAWLLYGIVLAFCIGFTIIDYIGEYNGNPLVNKLLEGQFPNLEGKEIRLGTAQSSLFSVLTTGTMTGTFSGVHDSFMPSGSFIMLSNMFLQMVWGGQGTGTAYLFTYVVLAVFVTGLMVGRTPEFLGRKIEKREVILSSILILLIHPIIILLPGAIAITFPSAPPTVINQGFYNGISNPGFHGLVQVFYEYTSAAANNGSGMAGLGNQYPAPSALWWNLSCLFPLLLGRYVPAVALLLLADSMSRKQPVPMNSGTLRTNTGLFTSVTAGVILVMGALTFLPILVLGPIAEAFEIAKAAL